MHEKSFKNIYNILINRESRKQFWKYEDFYVNVWKAGLLIHSVEENLRDIHNSYIT